jgi:hypothetical protein
MFLICSRLRIKQDVFCSSGERLAPQRRSAASSAVSEQDCAGQSIGKLAFSCHGEAHVSHQQRFADRGHGTHALAAQGLAMNEDYHQKVRQRAHGLWEQAGCPHGQDAEHWAQAEREIAAEGDTPPSVPVGKTTGRRGRTPSLSAEQTAVDAPKAKPGRAARSAEGVSTEALKATRGRKPKAVPEAGGEAVKVPRGRRSKGAAADEENAPKTAPSHMPNVAAEDGDTAG